MNVYIEYCEKWNYRPEFDRVSNIILSIDKTVNVVGNQKPPRTGSFEIVIGNKLIFSKLSADRFPSEAEICTWLK